MLDLSNDKIDIKCNCGKKHFVTLKQVMERKSINCSCGTNIQLEDGDGSVKKGINSLNEAFKRLDDSFRF